MQSFDFAKGELKKLDQMNKLVRNVYSQYVVGSVYVFNSPLGLKNINPLFKKSYFSINVDGFNNALHNAIYNPSEVNEAIKDKVKSFYVDDDNYIIFYNGKSNEEFHVGRKINENMVADMEEKLLYNYSEEITNDFSKEAYIYQKDSTLEIIDRLNNYEVITLRCNEDKEIALIMTNKLFPNSKKMEHFTINWIVKEDDEVFLIDIASLYYDDSILFKTLLKGIRC